MLDHLAISVISASVLYFVLLMLIAVAVYSVGLIYEWRKRR
jgi:NADH:ubiquinone oxidoreductase subunit 3 (subunit A)